MTTSSSDERPCLVRGALIAPDNEACPHCGHDRVFDPPRLGEPRPVSIIERVMLTMLYVEDRDSSWWDRPGRVAFVVVVAVIGYILWLSASVP